MAGYKKNLRLVQEHLDSEENIQASVYGTYERELMGSEVPKNGILVATEKRVVFFAKKMFGHDMESFLFNNISSIENSKGFMGHSITIHASGNKVNMKWINSGNVKEFTEYVNEKLNSAKEKSSNESTNTNEEDIPSQIQKLADLKEKGLLTEEEFENKKSELLNKM
jgi:hypothetical protein